MRGRLVINFGRAIRLIVIATVVALSVAINLGCNDFSCYYHYDELKKIQFVKNGQQDFFHPILLLELIRLPNSVLRLVSDQEVAVLGRTMVGIVGTILVAISFLLTKRVYDFRIAIVVAASVGLCPTVVIHCHYIKEDILLTTCLFGSLLAFDSVMKRSSIANWYILGVMSGLAFSSHYKSLLLVPVFALCWLVEHLKRREGELIQPTWSRQLSGLAVAIFTSVVVFLAINSPAIDDWARFIRGVTFEAKHAVDGHMGQRIDAVPQWFSYHLRYSLVPGMTPGMCILGVVGLLTSLYRWREVPSTMLYLAIFSIVFYLVPELSPSKPPPDDGRYVIPVAVGLLCSTASLVDLVFRQKARVQILAMVFFCVCLSWAALDSYLLVQNLKHDTRQAALEWIDQNIPSNQKVQFGPMSLYRGTSDTVGFSLNNVSGDYLVLSSFYYDRYLMLSKYPRQDSAVYGIAKEVNGYFELPFVEFRPKYRSFAFSNPTIRIVQLSQPNVEASGTR